MDKLKTCKNCNSEVNSNYCHNCGQRTSIYKVTFSETFQDVINSMFSIDAPLWVTIKTLILNPGKLFRDYLSGKRKTYYKPVTFFILTTIVFVLVKALLNYDPMQNMVQVQQGSKDLSLFYDAGIYMAKNINNIIFTFVFSFAVLTKLFFYGKYSLAEYLAVSFFTVGFYMIITTVTMFLLQFGVAQLRMVPFVLMFFYVIYALMSLFQTKDLLTIIKIVLVYLFAIIFYLFLGYGISLLIVWIKSF
uniref:DUF3667 domain-containing protein n=2 Tax=Gelidibacter sp. TaxID=2018083 RepID=UPI00404B6AD8